MFEENRENFRQWLIDDKGLSLKASGDVICRCKRLDSEVIKSIDLSISSPEFYLMALKDIKTYAIANKTNKQTQYTLMSTLRAAMKKYCEYVNPKKFEQYPNGYSISR